MLTTCNDATGSHTKRSWLYRRYVGLFLLVGDDLACVYLNMLMLVTCIEKTGAKVLEKLWYSTRSAGSNLMEGETSTTTITTTTTIATLLFLKSK